MTGPPLKSPSASNSSQDDENDLLTGDVTVDDGMLFIY